MVMMKKIANYGNDDSSGNTRLFLFGDGTSQNSTISIFCCDNGKRILKVSFWPFILTTHEQVSIMGTIHFWGLTIDIVTTMFLVLAVGLSVDYSSHIGHTFMTISGTRLGKSVKVKNIQCSFINK